MLHKTDSLIMADSILRLIRDDKRMKNIKGTIKPYISNTDHGYTIELFLLDTNYTVSFAMEFSGRIVVYIGNNAFSFLENCLEEKKLFASENILEAKEYIINAIISIIKRYNVCFKRI